MIETENHKRLGFAYQYTKTLTGKAKQSYSIRRKLALGFGERMCFFKTDINTDTGEVYNSPVEFAKMPERELKAEFQGTNMEHLYNYYRRLGLNQTVYAVHEMNGYGQQQALLTRYSMHALCPLWSWRKSRIIRRKMVGFFQENEDLLENLTPCHLVLTLRHDDEGYFLGEKHIKKRFFARDLIEVFKSFRKDNSDERRHGMQFARYFTGGTYNMEVKKSKRNGLHCHLHCMVLVPTEKVDEARQWIKNEWEARTGANQVVLDRVYFMKDGKKCEYDKQTWTKENLAHAVMECLKYQFKGNEFLDNCGKLDFEHLGEVLESSKNLRYYSRFGSLYGVKCLAFNFEKPDEFADDLERLKDYHNDILDSEDLYKEIKQIALKHNMSEQTMYENYIQMKQIKDFKAKDACFVSRYMEVVNPLNGNIDRNFKLVLGFPAFQREVQGALVADRRELFEIHPKYNRVESLGELYKQFYTSDSLGLLKTKERKRFYFYIKKIKNAKNAKKNKENKENLCLEFG